MGLVTDCVVMAELFCGQASGERLGGGGDFKKRKIYSHEKSFFKFNVAFVCLRACSLVTLTWDS